MVNHEMVVLAREYRNLTQEELARQVKVTQGTISKVEGNIAPELSEQIIPRIAAALKFPLEFFHQPGERLGFGSSSFYYRKKAAMTAADRKRISGVVNVLRLAIKRLLNSVELEPSRKLPFFRLDDFGDSPEHVARAVRAAWNLPEGPVNNVTALVESAGVIVISVRARWMRQACDSPICRLCSLSARQSLAIAGGSRSLTNSGTWLCTTSPAKRWRRRQTSSRQNS
jgi:transcriptional regulator with XRE-family HTH domain